MAGCWNYSMCIRGTPYCKWCCDIDMGCYGEKNMNLDSEIVKTKQRLKQLKNIKQLEKKRHALECTVYKPHPRTVLLYMFDSFIDLVARE